MDPGEHLKSETGRPQQARGGGTHSVLIVTNGHPSRNPRPVKEAFALAEAGFDVTLLHVANHRPSVPLDRALLAGAPFRVASVDLLSGSPSRAFLVRARTALARRLNRFGASRIEALGPAPELLAKARRIPADLTIVHNEISHWVGLRLMRDGRRVSADIEDWHSEDLLPEARRERPLPALRALERTLLHSAEYVTTTSEALADALHARYGGVRPSAIMNAFPLQPSPEARAAGTIPRFFWFSQTIGLGRGLEAFIAAWASCSQRSRLVLLGDVDEAYRNRLVALATPARAADLEFLPIVPAAELPGVIARHDVGLALEDASIPNRDLTVTNKILQYLNAGLAVVASPTAGQREVLAHAPEAGIVADFGDPRRMAVVLDDFVADRGRLESRRRAARELAEARYCWEREAPKLVALVRSALT